MRLIPTKTKEVEAKPCCGHTFTFFPFHRPAAVDTESRALSHHIKKIQPLGRNTHIAHSSLHKKETRFHCIWATVAFRVCVTATSITLIQTTQEWLPGSKERRLINGFINYNALSNTLATLKIPQLSLEPLTTKHVLSSGEPGLSRMDSFSLPDWYPATVLLDPQQCWLESKDPTICLSAEEITHPILIYPSNGTKARQN